MTNLTGQQVDNITTITVQFVVNWNREKGLPLTELERKSYTINYELDCNSSTNSSYKLTGCKNTAFLQKYIFVKKQLF